MQSRAEQIIAGKQRKQSKSKQSKTEQNSADQKKQSRTDALKVPNKSVTKVWELEKQDKRNESHIDRAPRVTQPLSTPRGPRDPRSCRGKDRPRTQLRHTSSIHARQMPSRRTGCSNPSPLKWLFNWKRTLRATRVPADRRVCQLYGFGSISQSVETHLRLDSYLKNNISRTTTTPACESVNKADLKHAQ